LAWGNVTYPCSAAGWVGGVLWVAFGLLGLSILVRCQTPPEERPAQQPQQPALQQTLQRHAQESRQRSAARRGLARQEREAARAEARSQKRAQREAEQAAHKAEAAARAEVEARTLRATYMGDLPSLAHTGAAVVVRAQDGASVTIRVAGAEATIPTASILEVSLAQGSRVTSRGSSGARAAPSSATS
jgi:hypothetical protein